MSDLFDELTWVGIIGSRTRDGDEAYFSIKSQFVRLYVPDKTVIVSGGCKKGGDRFAEIIAAEFGMPRDERRSDVPKIPGMNGQRIVIHWPDLDALADVPPRWRSTRANYARNTLIARDARDHLIASVAWTRKGGTEDTINKFRKFHGKEPMIA